MVALAPFDGKTLNASAVGRALKVSHTTASHWIRSLEQDRLLWILRDFEHRRRRVLVLRTSNLTSRLIEGIQRILPSSGLTSWRCGCARRVPVIADLGVERIGFCICESLFPRRKDWLPLLVAGRRGIIQRGFFLHTEEGASIKTSTIVALPLDSLLSAPAAWILDTTDEQRRRAAVWSFNRERLAAWMGHR